MDVYLCVCPAALRRLFQRSLEPFLKSSSDGNFFIPCLLAVNESPPPILPNQDFFCTSKYFSNEDNLYALFSVNQ